MPDQTEGDYHSTLIEQVGTQWQLAVWECAPGPCDDDFISSFPNRDAAITAVLHYHLGGPTLLGPWVMPFHRHPELAFAQVCFVLAHAVTIDQETFDGIAERRNQKIFGNYRFGKTRWEWALQARFLTIPHSSNAGLVLRLRRDAQECYIVRQRTT